MLRSKYLLFSDKSYGWFILLREGVASLFINWTSRMVPHFGHTGKHLLPGNIYIIYNHIMYIHHDIYHTNALRVKLGHTQNRIVHTKDRPNSAVCGS